MLCLPAFTPVANEAHAVGDSGECVVWSGEKPPCLASAAMCGSLPSAIHFSTRCGSMPSKPRMTSFWPNFEGPRRGEDEQASETAATVRAAAARIRTDLRMEVGGIITPAMEPILADARVALRRLWRAPGFALFAVVSLAVGIGVSTAIYSAVRTLLWMPLGVPDEQALVAVSSHRVRNLAMSWVDFQDFRVRQTSAAALAAETQVRSALSVGRSS